jgi:Zn-dependent protease with chaperone function/competence protein ComGC
MLLPPMNTPTPPPAIGFIHLAPSNLTSERERRYFPLVIVASVLLWLALAITIVGIFYALLIAFFIWLGHGLLAAHLRAEAVRVTAQQMPELHTTFLEVCQRFGVSTPPRLYVLQAGGALNAFATRHAGRDFVVVYSDYLEAFGPSSPEIKFILGHELGHLRSNHILKHALLAPGLFCPLLGPAYRRSWETSCDRHGAFAAQDLSGVLRAMLTLSGGKQNGRTLNPEAFAHQYEEERGFFVSLHELTSHYPTLSRRVRDLQNLQHDTPTRAAPRNPFAYFVALFMPGGQAGNAGPAGALIVVVIIGLMAAMAIPAFQKVRTASIEKACLNNRRMLASVLDQYSLEHAGKAPQNFSEVVGPGKLLTTMPVCPAHGTYSAQRTKDGYEISCSIHGHGEAFSTGAQPSR